MTMQLLDRTQWIDAEATDRTHGERQPQRNEEQAALAAFLDRHWRLPTRARTYAFHGLATVGAADPWLVEALRPLQGKFTVVNSSVVVPLPAAIRRRAAALAAAAGNRARRDGRRIAAAFGEERRPVIRHEVRGGAAADPGPDVRFVADLRYRLTVAIADADAAPTAAGAGSGADHAAGDSLVFEPRRIPRPVRWFVLPLLVPDADALHLMAPETRLVYRSITGRAGAGSQDHYWYADSWARFHEPGRTAGCIQPAAVEYAAGIESGPPALLRPDPEDYDSFLYGGPSSGERSMWTDYSATTQRRLFVPPGYCLVRFVCWAELAVSGSR